MDAFGVSKLDDRAKNALATGTAGAVTGAAVLPGLSVHEGRKQIRANLKADPQIRANWKKTSLKNRGLLHLGEDVSRVRPWLTKAPLNKWTAGMAAGGAAAGSAGGYLAASLRRRRKAQEPVGKARSSDTAAAATGGLLGAGAGGGALAAGRTVHGAQTKTTRRGARLAPIAVDSKGTARLPKGMNRAEQAVWNAHNLRNAPVRGEGTLRALTPDRLGAVGRLGTKGKAAVVGGTGLVVGGAALGAKKLRERRVSVGG
jgi:hypothetical protein